jgi:outer membrane protein
MSILSRLSVCLLLVAGLYSTLTAQQAMTLSDCIVYAQNNNPQVRVAQLQVLDAEWRIKENKATGLPQVTAGVSYTGFIQRGGLPSSALGFAPSGPVDLSPFLTEFTPAQVGQLNGVFGSIFGGSGDEDAKVFFNPVHNVSGNLQASQLIFNNSYLVALKAAQYYREYVKIQMDVTLRTLKNQVTDAYLPALLISENVATLDKNIGNLEKLLNETTAVNKAGFAEQLDVDRLDLALTTLRSERANLLRQREIVVNAVKLTMGMPVTNELVLSDNVDKLLAENGDADLTSAPNYMSRPEYTTLLKGRELSGLQTELYTRPYLPTVAGFVQWQGGLQSGFGNKGTDVFNDWFFIPSTVGGITVSMNLWDSGLNKSRKQRAIIGEQTIDAQKSLLENAILLEVENARKLYLNAQERAANQQKNVDLAQRILNTTQTKYRAGLGSSFEVTQAEQGLYTAQQALLSARYDLLTSRIAIKRALGN